MVKSYKLTTNDLRILGKRQYSPCNSCSRGPRPGDYAYCGCGQEEQCEEKKKYDGYRSRVKNNNLEGLNSMLLEIDRYLAERKAAQERIDAVVQRITSTYGTDVAMSVTRNLYTDTL